MSESRFEKNAGKVAKFQTLFAVILCAIKYATQYVLVSFLMQITRYYEKYLRICDLRT